MEQHDYGRGFLGGRVVVEIVDVDFEACACAGITFLPSSRISSESA
jgi:hypothetical protein